MTKKYTNKSRLLGKIGEDNYRISDCPFHIPKENVKFFKALQDAGNNDPFSPSIYGNQITPGWMKSIYESVMATVAREVKKALNEGAWGYEPDQNDYVLDDRYEMNLEICNLIYDFCKRNLKSAADAWNNIGNIEWFFEQCVHIQDISEESMKKPVDKYYMWWMLMEKKNKDIIDLYEKSLKTCEKGEDWINSWSKPEKMRKRLQKCHKTLEEYQRYRKEYLDHQKKVNAEADSNDKEAEVTPQEEIVESTGFRFEKDSGFMFEGECCGGGDCAAAPGSMGGVSGSYNTPMNTVGVGNVVPAGSPALTGSEQSSDKFNGSGDIALGAKSRKNKKIPKIDGVTQFPISVKK